MGNMCMHLTNYAINKESDDYLANENDSDGDCGSKRSLESVYEQIRDEQGAVAARQVQD